MRRLAARTSTARPNTLTPDPTPGIRTTSGSKKLPTSHLGCGRTAYRNALLVICANFAALARRQVIVEPVDQVAVDKDDVAGLPGAPELVLGQAPVVEEPLAERVHPARPLEVVADDLLRGRVETAGERRGRP
jgi:hypothetical protein